MWALLTYLATTFADFHPPVFMIGNNPIPAAIMS